MGGILYTATDTGRCGSPDCRGEPRTGADQDPVALADWSLEFLWSRNDADVGITRDARDGKMYTATLMMGTCDVSRGESRKVMRLHDKMSCILEELRIQMDPAILTVCIIPYNMKADQHAMEMNAKVRNLNEIIRQIHQRSVLPIGLLDVAEQMERSFPEDASSDGIHFDRPSGVE